MKPVEEMSEAELRAFCEEGSGVKVPPAGAPHEEWQQWMVAHTFMLCARHIPDADEARVRAIAELVRGSSLPELRPHIEEALGRPLTAEELENRVGRRA
jgi:hypothetical protein